MQHRRAGIVRAAIDDVAIASLRIDRTRAAKAKGDDGTANRVLEVHPPIGLPGEHHARGLPRGVAIEVRPDSVVTRGERGSEPRLDRRPRPGGQAGHHALGLPSPASAGRETKAGQDEPDGHLVADS